MTQVVNAVYENGVLKPLQKLELADQEQVRLTVEPLPAVSVKPANPADDPLAGVREATGIPDLAEHFHEYRFGQPKP